MFGPRADSPVSAWPVACRAEKVEDRFHATPAAHWPRARQSRHLGPLRAAAGLCHWPVGLGRARSCERQRSIPRRQLLRTGTAHAARPCTQSGYRYLRVDKHFRSSNLVSFSKALVRCFIPKQDRLGNLKAGSLLLKTPPVSHDAALEWIGVDHDIIRLNRGELVQRLLFIVQPAVSTIVPRRSAEIWIS